MTTPTSASTPEPGSLLPQHARAVRAVAAVVALLGGAAFASGRAAAPEVPAATSSRTPAAERPRFDLTPYRGLGTWVDVYDWSRSFTGGHPVVGPADVDAMVAAGVQTLFVQTAKAEYPGDLVDPDLLLPLVERARARGLAVVGWYVPEFLDEAGDLRRLEATVALGLDGLAVDIEARRLADVAERNRRLVALSARLRARFPGRAIGGIVMPPVVTDVINPAWWPGFPWRELAPNFDVWLPMSYSTERGATSVWRDGYRYSIENILRLRERLGRPDAPVHAISGIADRLTRADLEGTLRAVDETRALGASLYDWRTTGAVAWPFLQRLRA
jgi:hypothetical protein